MVTTDEFSQCPHFRSSHKGLTRKNVVLIIFTLCRIIIIIITIIIIIIIITR